MFSCQLFLSLYIVRKYSFLIPCRFITPADIKNNVVCREGGGVYVNNYRLVSGSRTPDITRMVRRLSMQSWQRSALLAITRKAM